MLFGKRWATIAIPMYAVSEEPEQCDNPFKDSLSDDIKVSLVLLLQCRAASRKDCVEQRRTGAYNCITLPYLFQEPDQAYPGVW